jgi:hypothetical protein
MIRHERLRHQFVQYIPAPLEPGVLYISMEYATAAHSCCCGCGEEVVTPFTPTDWQMTFDGETVSLWPSVGSWSLPCRSHYIIHKGRVLVAPAWSDRRVAVGRMQDKVAKARHYGAADFLELPRPTPPEAANHASQKRSRWDLLGFLARIWGRRPSGQEETASTG